MCDGGDAVPDGEIAGLRLAAQRLRARVRQPRLPSAAGDELVELRAICDLVELEFAAVAAEFAGTDEYQIQGSVSPAAWIRHHCHMTETAASTAVWTGEQLDELPMSVRAVSEGKIGFAHLALLARTAGKIRSGMQPGARVDERQLLDSALVNSVGRFRHECAHIRHAADPEGARLEHVDQVERRYLELTIYADGMVGINAALDAAGGAAVRTALEPLANRSGADDSRDRHRRLADAMVELAEHALDGGTLPNRGRVRPHLQVTVSLETLRGMPGSAAGEMEWAGPVPAATVQRLACDASITRIVFGPDSSVIDVGRARRVATPAHRKALHARDRGCVWPACERSAAWTAAHHVRHWARRGATDMANLVLLCHRHHWLVHEGGWDLVRTDDRGVLTIPPHRVRPAARAPDAAIA